MDAEQYHREAIREIHQRAKEEAQPHVDALVRLESLRGPRPMIVPVDKKGHILVPEALRRSVDEA